MKSLQHVTHAYLRLNTAPIFLLQNRHRSNGQITAKNLQFSDSAIFWQQLFKNFNSEEADIVTQYYPNSPTAYICFSFIIALPNAPW